MKSFAQLKRDFSKGSVIKTVLNNVKPERTGQIRKIVKTQTNAIAFEIPEKDRYRNILGVWQLYLGYIGINQVTMSTTATS